MHLSPLFRLVRSGKALAAEATELGRAPHCETPSQRPRLVVRALIAHEDARIRDAYRRILLETDVNHDIAAFRELRSRAAHTGESVYSRASSFPRTRSFEVTCCGRAVTPSVGVAMYPKDGADGETLLRNADAAMYVAKEQRPGTYSFFDPAMNHAALRASERSPFTHCMSI